MLVLTRYVGQKIFINGDEIVITILSCTSNSVRIGIDAPKDISVHREEIYRRIVKEKQENETNET